MEPCSRIQWLFQFQYSQLSRTNVFLTYVRVNSDATIRIKIQLRYQIKWVVAWNLYFQIQGLNSTKFNSIEISTKTLTLPNPSFHIHDKAISKVVIVYISFKQKQVHCSLRERQFIAKKSSMLLKHCYFSTYNLLSIFPSKLYGIINLSILAMT